MGRKRITLTNEQVAQLERLAAFMKLDDIADFFGFSDATLERRMQEDPDVKRAYKRGRQRAVDEIATSLITKARNGNLTAIIFYLKTQAGWRETERREIVDITDHLTDEQLEAIVRGEPVT